MIVINFTEKTKSESIVYNGAIIKLRLDKVILPDGREAYREYAEHSGGVCVVPLTENGKVVMVRQYRYPVRSELFEIPAGKLNANEPHSVCGARELKEETGCTADEMVYLGMFNPCVGYSDEKLHVYLARGLSFGAATPDDGEFVEAVQYSFEEIDQMLYNGELADGKTIACIYMTKNYLNKEGMK